MPWISDDRYIETDLSEGELSTLHYTTRHVISELRKAEPDILEYVLPSLEKVETSFAAWWEVYCSTDRYMEPKKWARKHKPAKTALCDAMEELGLRVVILIRQGKLGKYSHLYPSLYRRGLTRPTNVSTFSAYYDTKFQHWVLTCRKQAAVLLSFTWEVSLDGGLTWILLGRSKTPTFTTATKKLDPDKQYLFRMIMRNPAGQSDYHFDNRHLAKVPLPDTPVRQSYYRPKKKRGRRRR